MGEAALQMQRTVEYELPFHKKSAAQLDTQLQALKRRHEDLTKGAATASTSFQQTCANLGIAGQNIVREVSALGGTLPARVEPVIGLCQDARVTEALDAYAQFAAHVHTAADAGTHMPTLDQVGPPTTTPGNMYRKLCYKYRMNRQCSVPRLCHQLSGRPVPV
jgi:hypothetical protein